MDVLWSIIYGTKINLEWMDYPLPQLLDLPTFPIVPCPPINIDFFLKPTISQNFEDSTPLICKWGGGGGGGGGVVMLKWLYLISVFVIFSY